MVHHFLNQFADLAGVFGATVVVVRSYSTLFEDIVDHICSLVGIVHRTSCYDNNVTLESSSHHATGRKTNILQ